MKILKIRVAIMPAFLAAFALSACLIGACLLLPMLLCTEISYSIILVFLSAALFLMLFLLTAEVVRFAVTFYTKMMGDHARCQSTGNSKTRNTPIHRQCCYPADSLKYGICHMSFNGCEIIAVHNVLVLQGRNSTLLDVANVFRNHGAMWFCGLLGSKPWAVGRVLDHYNVRNIRIDLDEMNKPGLYIVSYWNGIPWLSSLHTIAVTCNGTSYYAYNYGKRVDSFDPGNYRDSFICAYRVDS